VEEIEEVKEVKERKRTTDKRSQVVTFDREERNNEAMKEERLIGARTLILAERWS